MPASVPRKAGLTTFFGWMILLIGVAQPPPASAGEPACQYWAQWIGPAFGVPGAVGNWSDPSMWLAGVLPTDGGCAAIALPSNDPSGSPPGAALLDQDALLAWLMIDSGGSLVVLDGHTLTIGHPGISDVDPVVGPAPGAAGSVGILNSGLIEITGEALASQLEVAGPVVVLDGGGEVRLGDEWGAAIRGLTGQEHLLVQSQTIAGAGWLGQGSLTITNAGHIHADDPFRTLTVEPAAGPGGAGMVNAGHMKAANGGWLRLIGEFDNDGGLIEALNSSFIELDGATVSGGTLSTSGSGVARNMFEPAAWHDLTNLGHYMLGSTALHLSGMITNEGTISVVGDLTAAGAAGELGTSEIILTAGPDRASAPVVLDGAGEMSLLTTLLHSNGENLTLIHGPDHAIIGEGTIGDGDVSVVNFGSFVADGSNFLAFDPGSGNSLQNHGTLRTTAAGPGGGLAVTSGSFENHGIVEVIDGSQVILTPNVTNLSSCGGALKTGVWHVLADWLPTQLTMGGPNILVNQAEVVLSGPGALFPRIDSLAVNAGTFRILAGRSFQTQAFFSNTGVLGIGAESVLSVAGFFVNSSAATLNVHVAGGPGTQGPGPHGLIDVAGEATLAGTLEITFEEGVELQAGESIQFLTAGSITGQFSRVSGPPGIGVSYGPGTASLYASDDSPSAASGDDDPGSGHALLNALKVAGIFDGAALAETRPEDLIDVLLRELRTRD